MGPLGYCRLAAVDTSHITHSRTRSHYTFSRPPSSEAPDPDEDVTSGPAVLSTSKAPVPIETSSGLELPSPGPFQTISSPNDSLQEWLTPRVHYTTLSSRSVLTHTSPVGPTEGSEAESVGDDGRTPFEGFEAPSNTDKDVTDETHNTENIFFHMTEAELQIVKEKSNKESITILPEEKIELVAFGGTKETQETSEHETAITKERNTTRHKQDGVNAGQEVDNGEEFIGMNSMTSERENTEHKKTLTGKSKKRKNRNRKRKKKKRNRKRPKSGKERVNVQSFFSEDSSDNSQLDVKTSTHMHHLLDFHEDPVNNSDEEQIIAAFLKHPESHEVYYDNIGECAIRCSENKKAFTFTVPPYNTFHGFREQLMITHSEMKVSRSKIFLLT